MQLTKFYKLRIICTNGKNPSVADMLGCFLNRKELQINQLKHKQLLRRIHSGTLAHDNQVKHVHYLVEHETVLPSQKDDCLPILADFGNDQLSVQNVHEGEKIIFKP